MNLLKIDTTQDEIIVSIGEHELRSEAAGAVAENLVPMIEELLCKAKLCTSDLGGIEVNRGPGAWGGTRVGVVTAKMLAWSLGIPVNGASDDDALVLTPNYPGNYEDTLKKQA